MSKMQYFFYLSIFSSILIFNVGCSKQLTISNVNTKNDDINSSLAIDHQSESIISPYRDSMASKMNEVLNTSLVDMEVGCPEGLLGDFVADITYNRAIMESQNHVDFALLNNGGLRVPINKGDITRNRIYELMPFDNEIVIVELTGEKMLDLIEYVRKKSLEKNSRKAGVPVSGLRMTISDSSISRVFIGTVEFDKSRNYKVATSDYLANGGDHMDFFLNPVSITSTHIKLRDAIIEYIIQLKSKGIPVNAELDGRIYHAE